MSDPRAEQALSAGPHPNGSQPAELGGVEAERPAWQGRPGPALVFPPGPFWLVAG